MKFLKKKGKLLFALLLFTGVLFMPFHAQAADIASGTDWVLDDTGRLTFSSNAGISNWYSTGWLVHKEEVTSVDCSDSHITEIAPSAFSGCVNLSSVIWGNSLQSIGTNAFYNCLSLISVTIPASVGSNIGNNIFYNCLNLSSVTIQNSKISNWEFGNCSSLHSITIPAAVTSIGQFPFSRSGLREITIESPIPQSFGTDAFSGIDMSLTVIRVPSGTLSAYCTVFPAYASLMTDRGNSSVSDNDPSATGQSEVHSWQPSEQEQKKLFSRKTFEPVSFSYSRNPLLPGVVTLESEVQGEQFVDAVSTGQQGYQIGYTYNLYIGGQKLHKLPCPVSITMAVPASILKKGRSFEMIGTDEYGRPYILKDLDQDERTVTFTTDQPYAFALCYKD